MKKALVLLSGGLDSLLVARLLMAQKIKVKGVIFKSIFFDEKRAVEAAKQLKIPYQIIDLTKKLITILKKPKYGYGKGVNPCIDCHILMLKTAKKILIKEGFDFVATGEILNQRPFSQNKQALTLIAKKAKLARKLLRPLSEKILKNSHSQIKKLIKVESFPSIQGRSRKIQIKLAKKFKLEFSQPAGGCLLCEKEFAKKVVNLKESGLKFDEHNFNLLKIGRHYWNQNWHIIIGRNQAENKKLEELANQKEIIIAPANFSGPTALITIFCKKELKQKIKSIAIKSAQKEILKRTKKKPLNQNPLVFFGTTETSVKILKEIVKNKFPVGLIITPPDKPFGRGYKITPTPVATFGQENQIPVLKPERLDETTLKQAEKILGIKPLLGICAIYGKLIPENWLDWCGYILNLHPSLLPKYRGGAPVIKAILNGEKTSGFSIIKLGKEMDAGPIVFKQKILIKKNETAGELLERIFDLGTKNLIKILKNIYQPHPRFLEMTPQDQSKATFALVEDIKKNTQIQWKRSKKFILNQIRAFNPNPGAYTFIKIKEKKMRLKIWRAHIKQNNLILDEVQLEGKNKVSWKQLKEAYGISEKNLQ